MTREETILILQMWWNWHNGKMPVYPVPTEKFNEALEMAIEALNEMSIEEYRQRLMEVFHRTDHDELLTYIVMPKEEEFKSLEYILRQYKFEQRPLGKCKTCKHYNPYRDQFSYRYRGDGYCKSTITNSEGNAYINCHDEWYCANYEEEGDRNDGTKM